MQRTWCVFITKIWKGYQTELLKRVYQIFNKVDNRYKTLNSRFQDMLKIIDKLETENSLTRRGMVNQNSLIYEQKQMIERLIQVIYEMKSQKTREENEAKQYELYIDTFYPNFSQYYRNQQFNDYLRIRGRYKINLEDYAKDDEFIDEAEVPLLEDIMRLLNCIEMKPIEILKAKQIKDENSKLKTKIFEIQNITVKSLENQIKKFQKIIDENLEEHNQNMATMRTMTETITDLRDEIEELEKQIWEMSNKACKNAQVQCRIIHSKYCLFMTYLENEKDILVEEQPLQDNENEVTISKSSPLKKFKSVVRVISTLSSSLKLGVKPDKKKEEQEMIYRKVALFDQDQSDSNIKKPK